MNKYIAIIAALPGELSSLRKRLRGASVCAIGRFRAWKGVLAGHDVTLLCSGMGERNAREAATSLLCQMQPAALYSIGYGGAMRPGLAVGDLVLASQLYLVAGSIAEPVHAASLCQAPAFLGQHRFLGTILSTSDIVSKQRATILLPDHLPFPVLDMETAAIASIAGQAKIPLLALRAISDTADMELGFTLEEFCGRELNLSPWRVLFTAARKPWIIPQVLRLAMNSRIASKALADGVCDLLASYQPDRAATGE